MRADPKALAKPIRSQTPRPSPAIMQNQLFIDGEFVDAESRSHIPVLNPHDNSLITDVAEAQKADIDRAVEAARRAFPAWAKLAAADRGRLLLKLADAIEARMDELARLESLDTGHPLRDTRGLDVVRTAFTFRYFGGMADKVQGSVVPVEQGFLNYVLRQPLGVVGQIVPWNFPLMFTSWKMGPALAAGNTVVLKPAELTPLSSLPEWTRSPSPDRPPPAARSCRPRREASNGCSSSWVAKAPTSCSMTPIWWRR
jgi:aldehyde dehydrogenase (NAD+)